MEAAKLCILREQISNFSHTSLVCTLETRDASNALLYSQIRQAITEAAPCLGTSRIICDHNLCDYQQNHNL